MCVWEKFPSQSGPGAVLTTPHWLQALLTFSVLHLLCKKIFAVAQAHHLAAGQDPAHAVRGGGVLAPRPGSSLTAAPTVVLGGPKVGEAWQAVVWTHWERQPYKPFSAARGSHSFFVSSLGGGVCMCDPAPPHVAWGANFPT